LEQLAHSLNQQCQQLYQRLQEAERVINNINDFNLLLSVMDKSEFFDDSFITRCAELIQTRLSKMLDDVEEPESED